MSSVYFYWHNNMRDRGEGRKSYFRTEQICIYMYIIYNNMYYNIYIGLPSHYLISASLQTGYTHTHNISKYT